MPNPIHYYRPTSLHDALTLLNDHPDALATAGGALTFTGMLMPYDTVIDLQGVPELAIVSQQSDWEFGGAEPLARVLAAEWMPTVIRRSLTRALNPNLINNISIGESFRMRHHPLLWEWMAALHAHDIFVEGIDPTTGESLRSNILSLDGERIVRDCLIVKIGIPGINTQTNLRDALGAAVVSRTPAGEPIVNAAVYIAIDENGLVASLDNALCGVSREGVIGIDLHTLIDNPLNEANIASAVKAVSPQLNPPSDYKGSSEYRREMARVCVQRALLECLEQLR